MERSSMKAKWVESFEVGWLDSDIKGRAKLSALFNYLQETALKHAENMGFGYDDVKKNGQLWVVARILLKMNRYPRWREQITVETWPRGVEGMWAFREYRLIDSEGNELGGASSSWLVLDMSDRKPVAPELVFHALPYVNPQSATGEVPGRINAKKDLNDGVMHLVTYSEVDFYQHVNNTRYIDWVLDAIHQLKLKIDIKKININYMSEAKLDDIIVLKYNQTENRLVFKGELENGSTTIFLAEIN
ncbi:MAG: thioesterase [Bacteroidales bacterium]